MSTDKTGAVTSSCVLDMVIEKVDVVNDCFLRGHEFVDHFPLCKSLQSNDCRIPFLAGGPGVR